MKGYSIFLKGPSLLEPPHQIVWYHIQDTRWAGVLPTPAEMQSVYSTAPADWDGREIAKLRPRSRRVLPTVELLCSFSGLKKVLKPLIYLTMGQIVSLVFFYNYCFGIE